MVRGVVVGVLIVAVSRAAAAQAPGYDVHRLDGATFTEQLRSDVTTETGMSQRIRNIVRTATYSMVTRHDTLMVTADTTALRETADSATRVIDMDPVIGSRWTVMLDAAGVATVSDMPVLTGDIAEVSDISAAMADFFPAAPPLLAVRSLSRDSAQRLWHRAADSAGLERYHLTQQQHNVVRSSITDSVAVTSNSDVTEDADIVWDRARGPVAWTRHIVSVLTSRVGARAVRASADQRIVVRRIR